MGRMGLLRGLWGISLPLHASGKGGFIRDISQNIETDGYLTMGLKGIPQKSHPSSGTESRSFFFDCIAQDLLNEKHKIGDSE